MKPHTLATGLASGPRQHRLGVDSGSIYQPVGVENLEPSIVKLDDSLVAKALQDPINMNPGEARCVAEMLLRQGQAHFFGTVAPLECPVALHPD